MLNVPFRSPRHAIRCTLWEGSERQTVASQAVRAVSGLRMAVRFVLNIRVSFGAMEEIPRIKQSSMLQGRRSSIGLHECNRALDSHPLPSLRS